MMLHWLAGAKPPEGASDPDETGFIEPPDTPAPVFAARAFKHAIFGTPPTTQPKPRRHSNAEDAKSRNQMSRAGPPPMTRPKSAGDESVVPEPVSSPTKGILMTPGTAAAKRKTVTFGEHVLDNEHKSPLKSGLPDDCPGKFPSPWGKAGANDDNDDDADAPTEKGRRRSKLTEALEQARDESRKRRRSERRSKYEENDDHPKEFEDPKSESGRYWKTQYDVYRENSQREMKKLITKQKLAKSFAKDKDFQCTELADELRLEKKEVERLEKRTAELEAQLREMQEQLARRAEAEVKPLPANVGSVTEHKRSARAERSRSFRNDDAPEPPPAPRGSEPMPPRDDAGMPPRPRPEASKPELTRADAAPPKPRIKPRPESLRAKTNDDIWNQSFGSSSQAYSSRPTDKPLASPPDGRSVTSGTGLTPLTTLSVNALPAAKVARRDSAQPEPPDDRFAQEPLVRQEVTRSPKLDAGRTDSLVASPGLPQPSPDLKPRGARDMREMRAPSMSRKENHAEGESELSMPVPASSPFQATPVLSPPSSRAKRSYFDHGHDRAPKASEPAPAKESASPPIAPSELPRDGIKPTAAWNAINAPGAGTRMTSLTDRSGKEVGLDRIEAAKARMAARGRIVT